MKILVQRVSNASVVVDNQIIGAIEAGVVALVGFTHRDTFAEVEWLASKLVNLRIFEDEEGKMNHSLIQQQGSALIISQFTLYADCHAGRRPSFIQAASPELAKHLYELFIQEMRKANISVATGIFGAEMKVALVNDGPVTVMLERVR